MDWDYQNIKQYCVCVPGLYPQNIKQVLRVCSRTISILHLKQNNTPNLDQWPHQGLIILHTSGSINQNNVVTLEGKKHTNLYSITSSISKYYQLHWPYLRCAKHRRCNTNWGKRILSNSFVDNQTLTCLLISKFISYYTNSVPQFKICCLHYLQRVGWQTLRHLQHPFHNPGQTGRPSVVLRIRRIHNQVWGVKLHVKSSLRFSIGTTRFLMTPPPDLACSLTCSTAPDRKVSQAATKTFKPDWISQ